MPKPKTEEEFNISLSKLVEKYPCLYDFTRKDYTNNAIRASAWQDISQSLCEGVEDCKLRWKSLRGCVTRDRKFASQGNKNKKPYYLQQHLEFVKPFTRAANRTSRASVHLVNYPQATDADHLSSTDADEQDSHESSNLESQQQTVHLVNRQDEQCIQLQQLQQHVEQQTVVRTEVPIKRIHELPREDYITISSSEDNHPEMAFFRSLIPDINRMNPRQRSSFRLGVVSLVDQVLYGTTETQYTEPQPEPTPPCSTVVNWSH